MQKIKEEMIKSLHESLENVVANITYSHVLKQSVGYTLLNWGKLFRPCLHLVILQDFLGDYKKGVSFATAIEMLHVYGMLHDDLPALDDARFRRKKIANHLVFSEAQTLLAADGLQADAFGIIADSSVSPEKALKLITLMSQMVGSNGYVGGQSLDIINEREDIEYLDDAMITKIHFGKTGALIKAAVFGAGVIADASSDQLELLEKLAFEVGLAFQIRDDIIDVTRSEMETGKDTKSDMKKDKATYPKLYGLAKSEQLLDTHVNNALKLAIELFGDNSITYNYISESLKYKK